MMMWLRRLHGDEAGHNAPAGALVLGIIAAVALPWGVVGDIDWLTILGGATMGLALIGTTALTHREVDYPVLERLAALEAKSDD